jgi:uncharacterized coiled-coil protein SlyX
MAYDNSYENKQLKGRISELELQIKIQENELQKMRKLFCNQEYIMINLKEENNQLKKDKKL